MENFEEIKKGCCKISHLPFPLSRVRMVPVYSPLLTDKACQYLTECSGTAGWFILQHILILD